MVNIREEIRDLFWGRFIWIIYSFKISERNIFDDDYNVIDELENIIGIKDY